MEWKVIVGVSLVMTLEYNIDRSQKSELLEASLVMYL